MGTVSVQVGKGVTCDRMTFRHHKGDVSGVRRRYVLGDVRSFLCACVTCRSLLLSYVWSKCLFCQKVFYEKKLSSFLNCLRDFIPGKKQTRVVSPGMD
jgi:hypothetical protein